jgi:[ribosomal protein S5]-alanine N-acetyltransferase
VIHIETDRLFLRLVPLAGLASTAAGNIKATQGLVGEKLPEEWFEDSWVYKMRYDQWLEDPTYAPWSIRAIASKETGDIIGNMNCHHKPMPFLLNGKESLATELGYTIFEPWRRQGIAYEAITAFTAWAKTQGLESIILSIQPTNVASLALALKLGATQIGSQIDERDGPEDIYLFNIDSSLRRKPESL